MKKIFFALGVASFAFCVPYENATLSDLENRICDLEYIITPPVRPLAICGKGLFFSAEPLYWEVTEESLGYTSTGSFNLNNVNVDGLYILNLTNGKTRHPNFHWDWGFRIGAGYDTPYDGWDLYSTWTHYNDSADDRVARDGDPTPNHFAATGGSGDFISPFFVAQLFASPGLMNRAKAKWNMNLNLVDFELGREFYVSSFLTLRPFIGLRTGWINQKYNLFFLRFNWPANPTVVERQIFVDMKSKFSGIGARSGLNTQWILGKGFSVFGNAAFSFLDAVFKTSYKLRDEQPVTIVFIQGSGAGAIITVSPPFDDSFESNNRVHTAVAMADLALGLRWDRTTRNERFHFGIWGGYEQNIFFNQSRFMNFQNDFTLINGPPQPGGSSGGGNSPNFFTERGDLVAQGFTGGLEFGF